VKASETKIQPLHKYVTQECLGYFQSFVLLESYTLPCVCHVLKDKFSGTIQRLQNIFSIRFGDFYKRANKIRIFQNSFSNDINQAPFAHRNGGN
jgi:hypothetical protein